MTKRGLKLQNVILKFGEFNRGISTVNSTKLAIIKAMKLYFGLKH
jgi:hypothetical protein